MNEHGGIRCPLCSARIHFSFLGSPDLNAGTAHCRFSPLAAQFGLSGTIPWCPWVGSVKRSKRFGLEVIMLDRTDDAKVAEMRATIAATAFRKELPMKTREPSQIRQECEAAIDAAKSTGWPRGGEHEQAVERLQAEHAAASAERHVVDLRGWPMTPYTLDAAKRAIDKFLAENRCTRCGSLPDVRGRVFDVRLTPDGLAQHVFVPCPACGTRTVKGAQ